MSEEYKSGDTLPGETSDWKWRYLEASQRLEQYLQDASELRQQLQEQAEERRHMTERMSRYEAANAIMGRLAYEFNNLLTVIKGYSEMLHDQIRDVVIQAELEEVIKASDRAARIVKQLLSLQLNAAVTQSKGGLADHER